LVDFQIGWKKLAGMAGIWGRLSSDDEVGLLVDPLEVTDEGSAKASAVE
jgi:hypothetical protein